MKNDIAVTAIDQFLTLAEEDEQAFAAVMDAYKAPKPSRKAAIALASITAARPPANMAKLALSLIPNVEVLIESGNHNLVTDTAMAAILLATTIESAVLNILINLKSIQDEQFRQEMQTLILDCQTAAPRLQQLARQISKDLTMDSSDKSTRSRNN